MDEIKTRLDQLVRITKQLIAADDYKPPIGDSIMETFEKLRTLNKEPLSPKSSSPATIQHATAGICLETADLMAVDVGRNSRVDLSIANDSADLFQRYGQIQAKMGDLRHEMGDLLRIKFIDEMARLAVVYDSANVPLFMSRNFIRGRDETLKELDWNWMRQELKWHPSLMDLPNTLM